MAGAEEEKRPLGLQLVNDREQLLGLAAAWEDQAVYLPRRGFFTEEYLLDWTEKLMKTGAPVYTIHLKEQLAFLKDLPQGAAVSDLSIGAYLVNPLKDSYDADDLARDYLGKVLRSRTDYFGKMPLAQAEEEQHEEYLAYVCGLCVTGLKAGPQVTARVEELGMGPLYREIEMPLVQVLAHMQAEGIAVEKEAAERVRRAPEGTDRCGGAGNLPGLRRDL